MSFYNVFEWDRILESEMIKWEVKYNAISHRNYFSVNVSLLAVVFRQQISKNQQLQAKMSVFSHFLMKFNN